LGHTCNFTVFPTLSVSEQRKDFAKLLADPIPYSGQSKSYCFIGSLLHLFIESSGDRVIENKTKITQSLNGSIAQWLNVSMTRWLNRSMAQWLNSFI